MRAALSTLLLLAACAPAGGEAPAPGADVAAILGGAADATSSAVFLLDLRFDTGASICSAVLVTPRVLLTAAHCVDPAFRGATALTVRATNEPDDTMLTAADFIDVTQVSRHPRWNPSDSASPYDLAALLLARAPAGVAPAPLLRALPAGLTGQRLRVVGYGRTSASAGDSGTRRSTESTISGVSATSIAFGSAGASGICSGDSGGGGFLRGADQVERLAGVHSLVRSSSCGLGDDVRVDANLAFIDGFIAAHDPAQCGADGRCAAGCAPADVDCAPTCAADGQCATGCAAPDPDCPPSCAADGRCAASCATPDPDCAPTCAADGACASGCAAPDPDCAAGCPADSACDAACADADPDCPADGDVCTEDSACPGLQCLSDARGFRFCSRACTADAQCTRAMTCQAASCRPAPGGATLVQAGCAATPGFSPWSLALLLLFRLRR